MIGTSTPRSAQLAGDLRDGRRGRLGVDRDPDELRAGVGEPGDLDRGRVRIGRVRVRHRLDDDRMGAADEDAADVDADGRPSPRPEASGSTEALDGIGWRAAAEDLDSGRSNAASTQIEEREQDRRTRRGTSGARDVRQRSAEADPRPEDRLEDDHQSIRPPSSGGNGSAFTRARLADRMPAT